MPRATIPPTGDGHLLCFSQISTQGGMSGQMRQGWTVHHYEHAHTYRSQEDK